MGKNRWIGLGVAVAMSAGTWAQSPAKAAEAAPAPAPAATPTPTAPDKALTAAPAGKRNNPFGMLSTAPKKQVQPRIVQQWAAIDADGNGQVSFGDIQKVLPDFPAERFAVLDKNKDGLISKDELPKPGKPREGGKNAAQAINGIINQADADKDGKVSEAEFKTAMPKAPEGRFKELDSNKDGVLDKLDVPPPNQGGTRAADTDGDGKVSQAEFEARFTNMPKDRFAKVDKNGDGFLDEKDRAETKSGLNSSPRGWGDAMQNIITHSDADKDGKVSFEEYSKGKEALPRSAFDVFDSNKDGFLSKEDTGPRGKAGGAPPRASLSPDENKERYKRADKDGDGKLTLEEAKTEFPSITEERFKERDVNGDGKLGPDDRKAGADDAAEAPAAK